MNTEDSENFAKEAIEYMLNQQPFDPVFSQQLQLHRDKSRMEACILRNQAQEADQRNQPPFHSLISDSHTPTTLVSRVDAQVVGKKRVRALT